MGTVNGDQLRDIMTEGVIWSEETVIELPLLLSKRQAAELETVAYSQGMTVGEVIRWLIRAGLDSWGEPHQVA